MISINNFKLTAAGAEDIRWIGELESSVYSGIDIIPPDTLQKWYTVNPNAFWIIYNENKRIGHIDVLPLRNESLQQLIDSKIIEREINSSDLYPPAEKQIITNLYIESLAINIPGKVARSHALFTVLSKFREIAETICNPQNLKNLFAVSASPEGTALLKHMGFQILKSADERKDKHDLFTVSFEIFENKVMEITENR